MTLNIPLYRLSNQGLLNQKFTGPAELVRSLGAVQAQDFAGAKWAIGLRIKRVTDPEVEQAFTDGSILRTHLLRPTWHFVTPEDIRWMLDLTGPRVRAQMAYMDRRLELDTKLFKKGQALLTRMLAGGKYLTRADLEQGFKQARLPAEGQRLGQLLMHAELDRVVCSGPRRGRQFTYALLEERVPPARSWTRDQSLAELVRRYFMTRGPATLADFAWWSGLTLSDARNGMEMVKSQFHSETVDEQTYWFSDSPPRTRLRSPAAHLLPNYDEYFIGFRDRSPIGQVARQAGIDKSDPALLANIVILDGQVVGGWKRTLRREEVAIETSLFIQPSQAEEKAIRDAAERFGAFLGLPVSYGQKEYATDRRWNSRSF